MFFYVFNICFLTRRKPMPEILKFISLFLNSKLKQIPCKKNFCVVKASSTIRNLFSLAQYAFFVNKRPKNSIDQNSLVLGFTRWFAATHLLIFSLIFTCLHLLHFIFSYRFHQSVGHILQSFFLLRQHHQIVSIFHSFNDSASYLFQCLHIIRKDRTRRVSSSIRASLYFHSIGFSMLKCKKV